MAGSRRSAAHGPAEGVLCRYDLGHARDAHHEHRQADKPRRRRGWPRRPRAAIEPALTTSTDTDQNIRSVRGRITPARRPPHRVGIHSSTGRPPSRPHSSTAPGRKSTASTPAEHGIPTCSGAALNRTTTSCDSGLTPVSPRGILPQSPDGSNQAASAQNQTAASAGPAASDRPAGGHSRSGVAATSDAEPASGKAHYMRPATRWPAR